MFRTGAARDKLRAFFEMNVGKVVTSAELGKVAGTSEWARRVRELRNEFGMDILTHHDRSDLKPGQYVFASTKPRVATQRLISARTRALALDRDGFTCQMCGAGAGELHPYDGRRTHLQVGHILDKSKGGADDPDNLRTLCSVCNEGATNLTLSRPSEVDLLIQLRRAGRSEQRAVLAWLTRRFETEK